MILVAGSGAETKAEFCKALAAKVGGSVLNVQQLVAAASQQPGAEGEMLLGLLKERKLIPLDPQLALLQRTMASVAAPYLLCDFPRMLPHLKKLEAIVGGVGVALALKSEKRQTDEDTQRMTEIMLKPLRDKGRVVEITLLDALPISAESVREGEAALRDVIEMPNTPA